MSLLNDKATSITAAPSTAIKISGHVFVDGAHLKILTSDLYKKLIALKHMFRNQFKVFQPKNILEVYILRTPALLEYCNFEVNTESKFLKTSGQK